MSVPPCRAVLCPDAGQPLLAFACACTAVCLMLSHTAQHAIVLHYVCTGLAAYTACLRDQSVTMCPHIYMRNFHNLAHCTCEQNFLHCRKVYKAAAPSVRAALDDLGICAGWGRRLLLGKQWQLNLSRDG